MRNTTVPRPLSLRDSRPNTPVRAPSPIIKIEHTAPLLGREAQTLIECNQKLKELGIDETITLPQICVIGDQSTGKSSLIEAISTVQVPKAKGCCTQCPIAINLSSGANVNSPWTCSVYIEQRYDFDLTLVKKINKSNPLGPWQERDEPHFVKLETTNDKDKVAHLIKVAQAAILDPGRNPAYYLSSPEALQHANQVAKFSPNVIRLDISEADWPNLSFIDLPGVIANTSKTQDRYLVELIKNLVKGYACDPRSVNMLTLPMTHDIENSQACAIIQELKVEDRTLAVFTKSDLADKDQQAQFLAKFLGTDDGLGFQHGYHTVMMPDNKSLEEAKQLEARFFDEEPWTDLPISCRERLGIPSLSSYLRRLLFEKTAETLPGNLQAIKNRRDVVRAQLSELPAPLDNAVLPWRLNQDLAKFENSMTELFMAASTRRAWNNKSTEFRNLIVGSRPTLVLLTRAETKAMAAIEIQAQGEPVELPDDDEKPIVKKEIKNNTPVRVAAARVDPVHRFRLEEIRAINLDFYSAFHLGEIDPKAVDHMNKLSVKSWNRLLDDHMSGCSRLLQDQIGGNFELVFNKIKHLEVNTIIRDFIKKYIDDAAQAEWNLAEEACKREQTRPFTMDCDTLKLKEERCLQERRRKRVESRCKAVKARLDAAEGVIRSKRDEARAENLEPDPWDLEVQMSAKTRAYYDIASSRFTDIICQSIFYNLLPKCAEPLMVALREYLGVDDPSRHPTLISWMIEDREREALRRRLLHEEQKLEEGYTYIDNVLGSRDTSPNKRRQSGSPNAEEALESPTKRSKLAHAGDVVDLSEQMEGVENHS